MDYPLRHWEDTIDRSHQLRSGRRGVEMELSCQAGNLLAKQTYLCHWAVQLSTRRRKRGMLTRPSSTDDGVKIGWTRALHPYRELCKEK